MLASASAAPVAPAAFDVASVAPLVNREVRRFRPWRLDRADLMQAGFLGALEAWRRFDPGTGPYRPYAGPWIRKEVQRALAKGEFSLAVPPDIPAKAIAARQGSAGHAITLPLHRVLDEPGATADESLLVAHDNTEDEVGARLEQAAVRQIVGALPEPQRTMVLLRFGFDGGDARSAREVARLVGVSDFTVRWHLRKAEALLRPALADFQVDG